MDPVFGTIAFLIIMAAVIFGLIGQRPVNKIVAYLALNPAAMTKVFRAVSDACDGYEAGSQPAAFIKEALKEKARHATCECLAGIYRGQPFEVVHKKPLSLAAEFPKITVTLRGDMAMIEVNLGHSMVGYEPSSEAVVVRIKRAGVLTLDTRRPMIDVYQERYTPPPRAAAARAAPPTAPKRPEPDKRPPRRLT